MTDITLEELSKLHDRKDMAMNCPFCLTLNTARCVQIESKRNENDGEVVTVYQYKCYQCVRLIVVTSTVHYGWMTPIGAEKPELYFLM